MKNIDVFNGDADGICALIQLRLAHPTDSTLITGVKRDIQLLKKVSAKKGDKVTVLDISMEKNTNELHNLLAAGVSVFYVDHHIPGEIPKHINLEVIIDTSPTTCTSLLVDKYLKGKYREWAIVAAFGDNMRKSALSTAKKLLLSTSHIEQLKQLGISINYNGYGSNLDDLHFKPDQLYLEMVKYTSPFDFIKDSQSAYKKLQTGYDNDIALTNTLNPETSTKNTAIYKLPNELWARRVSGVFGNQLANQYPDRAHAILTDHPEGGFTVSVRAPINNLNHAGELCSKFPTGGGRKGAAGINQLPDGQVDAFISLFNETYLL